VTSTGEVTTLLGVPDFFGRVPVPALAAGTHIPLGRRCLNPIEGLAFSAGILYITTSGPNPVLAFNPANRFLYPLVGTDPHHPSVRSGPLPLFAPDLPPGRTASMGRADHIAVRDQQVLVATQFTTPTVREELVHFQLPPGAFGAALPAPAAGAGEEKGESKEVKEEKEGKEEKDPAPAGAGLVIQCDRPMVVASGRTLELRVRSADGAPRAGAHWRWQCEGEGVLAGDGDRALFRAPGVGMPRTFRVQVWDEAAPGRPAECVITVQPALD
jgi:hypothetical protein